MLEHMRTTIRLPDQLYRDVRERALRDGITVTTLIERAVREALRQGEEAPRSFTIKPFHGSGVHPGVDLSDSAALIDLMEG